ncbi:MAG: hypothetical protein KA713_20850 [Chryseotalea sp. WA131a]|jgi:hypothetical protein|nr:MAG: hypothetical protein KA713_20850 [Chryseotalea sp. WA131a]
MSLPTYYLQVNIGLAAVIIGCITKMEARKTSWFNRQAEIYSAHCI